MLRGIMTVASLEIGVQLQTPTFLAQRRVQSTTGSRYRGAYHDFISRPDLRPPRIQVNGIRSPGYIFFTTGSKSWNNPSVNTSLVIADQSGEIVWVHFSDARLLDLRPQIFEDQPVLTYWDGAFSDGNGDGVQHIVDSSFHIIANVTASVNIITDPHEFLLLGNTAYMTLVDLIPYDLEKFGGPKDGWLYSSRVQGLDARSSDVTFDWRVIEHVSLEDSLDPILPGMGTSLRPWDYAHVNSIDINPEDDTLLLSLRHMSSLLKLNGTTGETIWVLGGKHSDFAMHPGSDFSFQHDARWISSNTISLFDNALPSGFKFGDPSPPNITSRGLVLSLNTDTMACTVSKEFKHDSLPFSPAGGNMRFLQNGNPFVGYGVQPFAAEFGPDGSLLSKLQWGDRDNSLLGYRVYKSNWTSQPTSLPDVVLATKTLYMSWNGATEVSHWDIFIGAGSSHMQHAGRIPKAGLETAFDLSHIQTIGRPYLQVSALDRANRTLALSRIINGEGRLAQEDLGMALPALLSMLLVIALFGVCLKPSRSRKEVRACNAFDTSLNDTTLCREQSKSSSI